MDSFKFTTSALVVCCLAACGPGKTPASPPDVPLKQDLDRARDVQRDVDANAAATRSAVDQQERGDSERRDPAD